MYYFFKLCVQKKTRLANAAKVTSRFLAALIADKSIFT